MLLIWCGACLPLVACIPSYGFDQSAPEAGLDTGALPKDDGGSDAKPDAAIAPLVGIALSGEDNWIGASCAIRAGTLFCWGDNTRGLLARPELGGANTPTPGAVTGQSGPFSGVLQITGHEATFCARAATGVYCWGTGKNGGSTGPANNPIALQGADSVSAGGTLSCARKGTDAYCWGNNALAQLTGAFDAGSDVLLPTKIDALAGQVKEIAVGYDNACAIRLDGKVVCWGHNQGRQSGAFSGEMCGGEACIKTPTVVAGLSDIVQLSLGAWHSCAIDVNKRVLCWGSADRGQLGVTLSTTDCPDNSGPFACTEVPTHVVAMDGADQVAAAGGTTCVLLKGNVYCFGRNSEQQWGRNSVTSQGEVPQRVQLSATTDLSGIRAIGLRRHYGCAITDTGDVSCWGKATTGGLGSASSVNPYAAKVVFP